MEDLAVLSGRQLSIKPGSARHCNCLVPTGPSAAAPAWLCRHLPMPRPAGQALQHDCDVSHVMCFRAVTSAGSAELIAVSSLFTYDGYWHYINPRAGGKQLLMVSKIMVLVYTVLVRGTYKVKQQGQRQTAWQLQQQPSCCRL